MKKVLLALLVVAWTTTIFSQGTVLFDNRITGQLLTRVYMSYNWPPKVGNGADDTPSGTTDWSGYTALTGSGWMAAILAAPGSNVPQGSLTFGANPTVTTFRAGVNAGGFAIATATLNNVPPDAAAATLEIFVWDRATSGIIDPAIAYAVWQNGSSFLAGTSGTFTVNKIGGALNVPPELTGLQSFSITPIPEPTTIALMSFGAATLLTFRQRKEFRPLVDLCAVSSSSDSRA
jgi:hypothetical protein